MKDIYKNWSYSDFLTFTLYYAAMSDFRFAEEEKDLVFKHADKDKFWEISHLYKENSDYENAQVIMYFKDNFIKDSDDKSKVQDAIRELFDSDGEYNILEQTAKRAFDLLLR
jgi:hypothetical protein